MIRPPGLDGVVFSERSEGDIKSDPAARLWLTRAAGAPEEWATVRQVHGDAVARADGPGEVAEADAIWTSKPGLAVSVFTADCYGVVLVAPSAVGVAHAGWRGARRGVVRRLREVMTEANHAPIAAAVGPGIGPCCFEVGSDVLVEFPGRETRTSWNTPSVDLRAEVSEQLGELGAWISGSCTHHDAGLFSHRKDSTPKRLAAVGWVT